MKMSFAILQLIRSYSTIEGMKNCRSCIVSDTFILRLTVDQLAECTLFTVKLADFLESCIFYNANDYELIYDQPNVV